MTERLMCPYNPAHIVEPRRFRQHLDKCRKTALNAAQFEICKFDWNHHVKKTDLRAHEAACPSRLRVEKEVFSYSESSALSYLPKPTLLVSPETSTSGENWDEDALQMTFNHQERINSSPFMILPNGLTKSERKAYYLEHQQRLMQMSSDSSSQQSSSSPTYSALNNNNSSPKPGANASPAGISQPPARPPLGRGRGVATSAVIPGGVRAPVGPSGRGWSSNTAMKDVALDETDFPPLS